MSVLETNAKSAHISTSLNLAIWQCHNHHKFFWLLRQQFVNRASFVAMCLCVCVWLRHIWTTPTVTHSCDCLCLDHTDKTHSYDCVCLDHTDSNTQLWQFVCLDHTDSNTQLWQCVSGPHRQYHKAVTVCVWTTPTVTHSCDCVCPDHTDSNTQPR